MRNERLNSMFWMCQDSRLFLRTRLIVYVEGKHTFYVSFNRFVEFRSKKCLHDVVMCNNSMGEMKEQTFYFSKVFAYVSKTNTEIDDNGVEERN